MEILTVKTVVIAMTSVFVLCVQPAIVNTTNTTSSNETSQESSTWSTTGSYTETSQESGTWSTTGSYTNATNNQPDTRSTTYTTTDNNESSTATNETSMTSPTSSMTTYTMPHAQTTSAATTLMTGTMPSVTSTGPTTTTTTEGVGLRLEAIIGIGVGGGVILLVLILIIVCCCYRKCNVSGIRADKRPLSEIDEDGPTRMSMHRPDSAAIDDGHTDFITFSKKQQSQVSGIENPTYSTTIIDETQKNGHRDDQKVTEIEDGAATMPSKARLPQNYEAVTDEGADNDAVSDEGVRNDTVTGEGVPNDTVTDEVALNMNSKRQGDVRPISGVSYMSADIDMALETLDVGTV